MEASQYVSTEFIETKRHKARIDHSVFASAEWSCRNINWVALWRNQQGQCWLMQRCQIIYGLKQLQPQYMWRIVHQSPPSKKVQHPTSDGMERSPNKVTWKCLAGTRMPTSHPWLSKTKRKLKHFAWSLYKGYRLLDDKALNTVVRGDVHVVLSTYHSLKTTQGTYSDITTAIGPNGYSRWSTAMMVQ